MRPIGPAGGARPAAFVLAGVEPADLTWTVAGIGANTGTGTGADTDSETGDAVPEREGGFNLPRSLVALAAVAFQAREPERFGLLYALIWRAHQGTLDPDDLDLRLARRWSLSVRADAHRMRALVRFAPATIDGEPHYLGWYDPEHFVLEANARLLARRDPAKRFTIVTPDATAHRDRGRAPLRRRAEEPRR